MKKLISVIFGLFFMCGFIVAGNVNQVDLANKYSACNGNESETVKYYITSNHTSKPNDRFWNHSVDSFISAGNSSVQIWRNGVIAGCSDWGRVSNVVEKTDVNGVLAMQNIDTCIFTTPNYLKTGNKATEIDAQIHYVIGYYEKGSIFNSSITDRFYYRDYGQQTWTCYPGGEIKSDFSDCPSKKVHYKNTIKYHTGECLNYKIFRCGDGLVNSPYGSSYNNGSHIEQCDPKDPNHTNWGLYGCTETCERNDTPVIPEPAPTCNITLSSNEINLGESATINYWISGAFNSPTYMEVAPSFIQGAFPYTIYCNAANNCQFTQGSTTIAGTSIPGVGTYTFTISGQSPNGDFSCQATLHVKSGTTPPPVSAPTCNITLSSNEINLGESATINYRISGAFNSPTYMEVAPSFIQGAFPYTIYCNTANNCQFTQGSTTIAGTSIPGVGTYTFTILGQSPNGDFNCQAILNVKNGDTPPPHTGHANVSIQKVLESVGPFSKGDEILYKIVAVNNGDATTIVPIWDEMPEAVTYLTSSIMFVPDIQAQHYTFSTGISNGRFMFRYDNVSLAPGQKAIIYLTGIINNNYIDDTTVSQFNSTVSHFYDGDMDCMQYRTNQVVAGYYSDITQNCAYTYSDGSGDNGSGNIVVSCVRFPKPTMIKYQSVRGIEFTRERLSVAPNEIITYKIEFGNEYGETMTDVKLVDVMPLCVEYVDSSVHGISGYRFSTGLYNAGNQVIYYTGFTLGSGQYGYMLVTGKISNSPSCQNVDTYRNDAYLLYSGGYINSFVVAKRPNVLLTKTGDGPHYDLSQPNTFYITVTNNSADTIYDVVLSEVNSWPTFSGCVNYIDRRGSNFTKTPNALEWKYNSPLQPGQSINLIISGSIGGDTSCVRDYINTVVLTYKDGAGYDYILDAKYPFDVTTGESAELKKTVDKHKVSIGDIVVYTIRYKNIGHVDRETGYSLTDIRPSDVLTYLSSNCNQIATCNETQSGTDVIFTFNSALHPGEGGTLVLRGKVKRPRSSREYKRNKVILKYRTKYYSGTLDDDDYIEYEEDDSNCGNGILEGNEQCDGGYDRDEREEGDRFYILNYLDFNRTTQADDTVAGKGYYCTESCNLDKTSSHDYSYNIPSCLNVDTTISIMENELFPFWWRIWQRDGIKMVNGGDSKSCNNYSTAENTVINKDTMKCTFSVYDGQGYNQAKKKALHTFTVDCFMKNNSDDDMYFKPFDNDTCAFSRCVDFDKVAARQIWNVSTLLGNKWEKDTYGEYKLALEKVEYQYCSQDGTWKDGALYDAVCEVNFALTKPYIMQVNTVGVPKATSSDFLDRFYDIAGHKIQTDINNIVKVSESSYNETQNVKSQVSQFKNKYEKLAVQVTNTNWGGGVSSVKKVPNQSIYFVKGNGTLQLSKSNNAVSKAFTIVVEGMDVEIDGSILTNGMIITDQTISFKDSNCTSGGQVVQGIFIAQGGFVKNDSTLNQRTNRPRCHRGNLHVKGVLIGKNINNITNSKRSQLNSWFETELKYANTNDAQLKKERRNEIFQGASVLIEYNPDTWMKSIPGAEIFTETLDVYKK